jgi:hypothetical protein
LTDHLSAIKATIPAGDPSSIERMEWCKAAAAAIADVLFEHSRNQTKGDVRVAFSDNVMDACIGVEMVRQHAVDHLLKRKAS